VDAVAAAAAAVDGGALAVQLDEDTTAKTRLDQVQVLKTSLKKLSTLMHRLNSEAQRYGKSNHAFVEGMEKLQLAEKRSRTDSVYVEALSRIADAEREVTTLITQFHQVPSDQIIARVIEFIQKDIAMELKVVRTKYEKARRDYDGAVDKVTALRSKTKVDPIKLYNAERELKKHKRLYEDSLGEMSSKLDDIDLKKSCNFLEWLISFLQQERDVYGECFAVVQHLEGYLDELTTWTNDMALYFRECCDKRAEEQGAMFQEERDSIYDPLLQLLSSHPGVGGIIQRIIAREGRGIAVPDGSSDRVGAANLHPFIREFYDSICQELLLAGYRDQARELASAMGLLEKAKDDFG